MVLCVYRRVSGVALTRTYIPFPRYSSYVYRSDPHIPAPMRAPRSFRDRALLNDEPFASRFLVRSVASESRSRSGGVDVSVWVEDLVQEVKRGGVSHSTSTLNDHNVSLGGMLALTFCA